MSTFTNGTDRAAGYVVTHTNWNEQLGASGSMMKLREGTGFHARRTTNQSINSATPTKVQVGTEVTDTDGWYDNSVNYRFTPLLADTFLVVASVYMVNVSGAVALEIRLNGAFYDGLVLEKPTAADVSLSCSTLIAFNGTTDYIEIFASHASGAARNVSLATFGAMRVFN